ncbi:MAG: hypothetical protein MI924_30525 [Chloroflexales bacterium]|nr:hypothetical protein [Chloroflexales bacterium]
MLTSFGGAQGRRLKVRSAFIGGYLRCQRAIAEDRLVSQAYTASPPRAASPGGQLRIDPGEAFGKLYVKLGVDVQQLGVDSKETKKFVMGLGAAPELDQQGYRLWRRPTLTQPFASVPKALSRS